MKPMSRWSWMIVMGLVVLGSALMAQAKPNFSGRWVQVSPARNAGQEDIVTHEATTLTIGRASQGPDRVVSYKIDGTEGRTVTNVQGTEMVITSKAEWVGLALVVTSTIPLPDGSKMTTRHQWAIDAEGRLVIDATTSLPGVPVREEKIIYTKK